MWGVDYDDTLDESNELRSTTGVAANWLSTIGPMTFVLSTNLSKADTDKTETFNFNLGTTFNEEVIYHFIFNIFANISER